MKYDILYSDENVNVYRPLDQEAMNKLGGSYLPLYNSKRDWSGEWGELFVVHVGKDRFLLREYGFYAREGTSHALLDNYALGKAVLIFADPFLDHLPEGALRAMGDDFLAKIPNYQVGLRHFSPLYRQKNAISAKRIITFEDFELVPVEYREDRSFVLGLNRITNKWLWKYLSETHPEWIDTSNSTTFRYDIIPNVSASFWTDEMKLKAAEEYACYSYGSTARDFVAYIPKPWTAEVERLYWRIVTHIGVHGDVMVNLHRFGDVKFTAAFPHYNDVPEEFRDEAMACLAVYPADISEVSLTGKQLYAVITNSAMIKEMVESARRYHSAAATIYLEGYAYEPVAPFLTDADIDAVSEYVGNEMRTRTHNLLTQRRESKGDLCSNDVLKI